MQGFTLFSSEILWHDAVKYFLLGGGFIGVMLIGNTISVKTELFTLYLFRLSVFLVL